MYNVPINSTILLQRIYFLIQISQLALQTSLVLMLEPGQWCAISGNWSIRPSQADAWQNTEDHPAVRIDKFRTCYSTSPGFTLGAFHKNTSLISKPCSTSLSARGLRTRHPWTRAMIKLDPASTSGLHEGRTTCSVTLSSSGPLTSKLTLKLVSRKNLHVCVHPDPHNQCKAPPSSYIADKAPSNKSFESHALTEYSQLFAILSGYWLVISMHSTR